MPISILLIFPLLCFFALRKTTASEWRASFLLAALLWGAAVLLVTEFLSFLKLLAFGPLLAAWVVACTVPIGVLIYGRAHPMRRQAASPANRASPFEKLILFYLAAVLATTAVLAWVAPPNTWDSMTYHMSRVVHWVQNRSVDFYPTAILRQLHSNPWAEYAILNLQLATGGDRLANFVQWFAMAGSVLGVSLIAKELGAARRGQVFAAAVCASIPMGILQSTSTQTDYAVAFWLVCLVYFSLRLIEKADALHALGVGLALGLALLTKGTAYVFAFSFVAWLVLSSLRQRDRRKLVLVGGALVVAVVVNVPHYARNFEMYGSPLGPGSEGGDFVYANQLLSPAAITSNVLRNLGLNLAIYEPVDRATEKIIYKVHERLGISPKDPRTTWPGTEFHVRDSHNEDDAGNTAPLLLIVIALVIYLSQPGKHWRVSIYAGSIVFAFLFFSTYLKWQPWHSRLQLPMFVLWAPFVGLMLARWRRFELGSILLVLLILASLPSFVFSATKPVLSASGIFDTGRTHQYFFKNPSVESPYGAAAQAIAEMQCRDVGLMIGGDDWEYPLWVMLKEKIGPDLRLEHVNVTNVSRKKLAHQAGDVGFEPCAIFVVNPAPENSIVVSGRGFIRRWNSGAVNVYGTTQ
ncbi:glycosyltransferase family 39 protein [Variovorax sp. J31P179]|uniref:glycosyltransferase family 39 protein n=1 Tax=Variovorax sp. J31P179 TaxID=3053508 RepID=UPI002575F421|nr:glycosyltransferase family 39 protein [Variovorax sp. J31P179]MDM0081991.1 glycosyltransferase family 39 protein [Variovorax sp. J31P179]